MAVGRKPFQGVMNIVRFNWHFYVIALLLMSAGGGLAYYMQIPVLAPLTGLAFIACLLSLLVSMYIYDLSGLYTLNWIAAASGEKLIVNIHAGFDETSTLLQDKYPDAAVQIIDFYDPEKHTEISIKRARNRYPGLPQTVTAETHHLPLADAAADKIFVIFSAHEIRDWEERKLFMKELARSMHTEGRIYITEHLRDLPNFLAYNIGFFHFYPKQDWLRLFEDTGLQLEREIKLTPFISTFIIAKNDTAL
ncbi:Methyltransferase domain-containing protein [Chitinophaga sp. YR627]|uniref:class I SAM-dependent methyltransferase n=1 Tax=Chitinophaga sp. YR627 TaxID=1881041 RepID=UPI0008E83D92|nr:methyltransferase domain-containing protein [Chitinophaga sp. YR627]SFM84508.1 Methyltransferase domain-containing protein [Chitinophaga sp. YR627]